MLFFMLKWPPFPHREGFELLAGHFLNCNTTESQFARLTRCSGQCAPFPSRPFFPRVSASVADTCASSLHRQSLMPRRRQSVAKLSKKKKKKIRKPLSTLENSCHQAAGFVNVISDADAAQLAIRVRRSDFLKVVIQNSVSHDQTYDDTRRQTFYMSRENSSVAVLVHDFLSQCLSLLCRWCRMDVKTVNTTDWHALIGLEFMFRTLLKRKEDLKATFDSSWRLDKVSFQAPPMGGATTTALAR